ncbi:MAG: LysR family transcriptional regulator [Pseudomonadota bacterium]
MTDFDNLKLRRIDFSLLLIFLGLVRHGRAARVAQEMGLSQPAISHALGRLRDIFDDPLFLRRPHGLEPTSVARELEPRIRAAVEQLAAALEPAGPFIPGDTERVLRIAALDYEIATILPQVVRRLSVEAPGVRLSVRGLDRDTIFDTLSEGSIDLVLGYLWRVPPAILITPLLTEDYLVVGRPDLPAMQAPLTIERFLEARHLVVSPSGKLSGIVDRALSRQGHERQIAVVVPQFLPALALLAESDLIATMPSRFVRAHASRFGLVWAPPPIDVRPFSGSAARHVRDENNPFLNWAIGLLKEAAAKQA